MGQKPINPELRRQLAEAPASKPLEATVTLDPGPGRQVIPEDEVDSKVRQVLREVAREVGEDHEVVNIFEHLGSFSIRARPAFLAALVNHPDVCAAMANQQNEDILIRPVRKGPIPKQ